MTRCDSLVGVVASRRRVGSRSPHSSGAPRRPTMVRRLRWQDPGGRNVLKTIVKKVIPEWKDGLRPVQEDLVTLILDGEDVLCCTATGDGKSAAFSVPILALNEYNNNPHLYAPNLRTRVEPVGIVVTPTKGLANNIVGTLPSILSPSQCCDRCWNSASLEYQRWRTVVRLWLMLVGKAGIWRRKSRNVLNGRSSALIQSISGTKNGV